MIEEFKIYIDRLKDGDVQRIEGSFDPAFLELDEPELHFKKPIKIKGEAYVADDHLVLHLSAATLVELPCAICNELFYQPLSSVNFYETEALEDIPAAIYDFGIAVREALLTELPKIAECNQGQCPQRETITPYMKSEKRGGDTTHFPFSDIDKP